METYNMNIFFAHVKNTNNMGDKRCCPYYYYEQYFKNYHCPIIDLNQIKNSNINNNDFIIIGGGGILNHSKDWNDWINSAFSKTKNVIFWGCGYNTYNNKINDFESLHLEDSLLLGIRDYYHPYLKFLPCVSCKSIFFNKSYTIKRKIGIVKHYNYKIQLDDSLNKYDVIYNDAWIEDIIKFIGESEYVLSDSYHALYWATLLNKKVGRLNNYQNTRFQYCMYQYPHIDTYNKIIDCKTFSITDNDLIYFRTLNDNFFNKVKKLIQK